MIYTPETTTHSAGPKAIALKAEFLSGVSSKARVSECPHNLYKYPARFAPEFAREAIRAFSSPGDLVMDVFQGGGTAIVEALALGRHAVGYDISELACFLTRVKTTPLSIHDERALLAWSQNAKFEPASIAVEAWAANDTEDGYYRRNLPDEAHQFFSTVISQLRLLRNERQRRFARLILLAIGQWALDCKSHSPTFSEMRAEFVERLKKDLASFRSYTQNTAKTLGLPNLSLASRRKIVKSSSEHCGKNGKPLPKSVALVVTSPPYPGVHMLYHRWQIQGRRETPAPFMIANCRDGDGASYYNLGRRSEAGLKTYYERLVRIFAAVKPCLKPDALVVQMVAFNQPDWQLPAYLESMQQAGFEQVFPRGAANGQLWREVPGRRWYASTGVVRREAGKEVVLFHKPA